MKLIVAIIDDQDAAKVIHALTDRHYGVTHISTTGALLSPGNSTLLVGVKNDPDTQRVMRVIDEVARRRTEYIPYTHPDGISFTGGVEVEVGGISAFALDVVHFEQV